MTTDSPPPFSARVRGSHRQIDNDFPKTGRIALLHLLDDLVRKRYVKGWNEVARELARIARIPPSELSPDKQELTEEILHRLTKTPITVELAKEVLHNTLKGMHKEVTVENIQRTICEYFNIKLADLKAKRRTKNIAFPRQVAMYLCRRHTSTSFPAIGDKFGGRDHSTVIHASKVVENS